jgi:hypothetical protein
MSVETCSFWADGRGHSTESSIGAMAGARPVHTSTSSMGAGAEAEAEALLELSSDLVRNAAGADKSSLTTRASALPPFWHILTCEGAYISRNIFGGSDKHSNQSDFSHHVFCKRVHDLSGCGNSTPPSELTSIVILLLFVQNCVWISSCRRHTLLRTPQHGSIH